METIKIWDLPTELKKRSIYYEHDGDKEDLRIFASDFFYFTNKDESAYNEAIKQIDKFEVKRHNYTIYLSYDVSGFSYWVENQEENNYLCPVIGFEESDFNMDNIKDLEMDIIQAYEFCDRIQDENPPIF